jgi:signal transduction histidine kinase
VDDPLQVLRRLVEEHDETIVDVATAWVRIGAQADLHTRPYEETRGLIVQEVAAYVGWLLAGDAAARDEFIERVTSIRSSMRFHVSTLLRGLMGFRHGVLHVLTQIEAPPERVLGILQRLDEAYAEFSLRTADIYMDKLYRVLDATREELIRKDKLAALGELVAGVAHEISTPLGVAVTAASLAADRLQEVEQAFVAGSLRRQDLQHGLAQAQEATRMTLGNLRRAADLVVNFKQIAVDQTSEALRTVALGPYLRDLVASLAPLYRRTPHRVMVVEAREVEVTTRVGAVSQVCTNLIQNALMHAYPRPGAAGTITLTVEGEGEEAVIVCADDGDGMTEAVQRRVFEPFFTTLRGRGGSGLGMHIVHALVTEVLGGSIALVSAPGAGTQVTVRLPVHAEVSHGGA